MKRLLGLALLFGCLALPVRAQDAAPSPDTLRAAQELAAIMSGDTMQQMTGAMSIQIWRAIESQLKEKVDAATLAELRTEFVSTLASYVGESKKEMPAVYAKYFNAQELRDMLAFYKSPTGAKALRVMPQVMTDITTRMVPRMQVFQRDLNARIIAVMQKHGYKN
jgi:hypothetical protein